MGCQESQVEEYFESKPKQNINCTKMISNRQTKKKTPQWDHLSILKQIFSALKPSEELGHSPWCNDLVAKNTLLTISLYIKSSTNTRLQNPGMKQVGSISGKSTISRGMGNGDYTCQNEATLWSCRREISCGR